MLSLFEQLLGREFWKYVILVFTHVDEHNRDLLEDNIDVLADPNGKTPIPLNLKVYYHIIRNLCFCHSRRICERTSPNISIR